MGLMPNPPWLLLASPEMCEDFFSQGVFLIIENDEDGSIGFLINRKCHEALDEVIEMSSSTMGEHIPTWFGGPVEADRGLILSDQRISDEDDLICDRCFITTAPEAIEELIQKHLENPPGKNTYSKRFISGYTAWEPGQLEAELRKGKWIAIQYDHEIVFNTSPGEQWQKAIASIGLSPARVFVQTPDSPLLNTK